MNIRITVYHGMGGRKRRGGSAHLFLVQQMSGGVRKFSSGANNRTGRCSAMKIQLDRVCSLKL